MKKATDCVLNPFTSTMRDSVVETLKDRFADSLDYFAVYRNFVYTQSYDAWVYDGTEEKETVGYKMIQSYPYDTPQFLEGDYIHFDYLHEGKMSTFLLLSLDTTKLIEVTGKMRPCTNELRFYNDAGVLCRIPVVVDNKVSSSNESESDIIPLIKGEMTVYCQLNASSALIIKNMRFLLGRPGNWTAWKVSASGVNNYMNRYWDDITSARVLGLTLEASEINSDTDDLVNGVAHGIPLVVPDPNPGDSGDAVFSVLITPDDSSILQGSTQVFTCVFQEDGVTIPGECVITNITTTVPTANYTFAVIDGNHFSITNNLKYLTVPASYVTILCEAGESGEYYKELKILLKGYF